MDFSEYIEINPEIRFGQPTLKNTRISVSDVLNWLASNMSIDEILFDFPELSLESIHACLKYAANKEARTRVVL